jgi:phage tail sheath protein FI
MTTYRAPDVYVEEIATFPPSVAEVGTAIPAFIGYTEKATSIAADDLKLVPTKLYSLREFEDYYGFPKAEDIPVDVDADADGKVPTGALATPPAVSFLLYYAVKMYFFNGGAQCYVVSVGGYGTSIEKDKLLGGLDVIALEDEPTLLVIPEATGLSYADYKEVSAAMLSQCQALGDRFAIFDVWKGDQRVDADVITGASTKEKLIKANREAWAGELKYGAAYYPFVTTTMNHFVKPDESNVKVTVKPAGGAAAPGGAAPAAVELGTLKDSNTAIYNLVKTKLKDQFIDMPPSALIAGVYAATDAARGVWKAPANVALLGVLEPVVKLNRAKQEDLNVDATAGKSINAIRAFAGKGTLVWGARTLAGNDNEWRYVSVRRFFNTVEESIKKSTYWAVFEPNDANTWVKVRGMVENYLIDKWREGALAGATPKDAFFVKCGLGTTMSPLDILGGKMNVEVGIAVVRPAEFIILKFSHKLQSS